MNIDNFKNAFLDLFRNWFPGSDDEQLVDDVKAVVISDIGNVRTNNEDNAIFIKPSRLNGRLGYLGIVADGMGGHKAGEVASKMAIDTIGNFYYRKIEDPKSRLGTALSRANKAIWKKAEDSPSLKGMGTTCTAVAVINEKLVVGHVGDSRMYHLKNNELIQITTDHTYVQELIKQGAITPEEADNHPERNILTKVMGTKSQVEFDIFESKIPFTHNDRILMCSDGLYDYFTNEELAEFLREPLVSTAAQNMVDLAKQRGGHDNITIMIIERVNAITPDISKTTREINLI